MENMQISALIENTPVFAYHDIQRDYTQAENHTFPLLFVFLVNALRWIDHLNNAAL